MKASLREETEKLERSWMRYESEALRDYLVAGVEDPRLNPQSILSRHFIIQSIFGSGFDLLMREELYFAAVLGALIRVISKVREPEEACAVLHAIRNGSDNAEGIEIPQHVVHGFKHLPALAGPVVVPNYVEKCLQTLQYANGRADPDLSVLDTFQVLWSRMLGSNDTGRLRNSDELKVLEPACGSANDYRFMVGFGLASHIDYCGFDLCEKNVLNAKQLFPDADFRVGNVFEIDAEPESYDVCFVHDLFEHLSLEGLESSVSELCRVTCQGICAHFFSMDEMRDHIVQPVEDYHWNRLSMQAVKHLFASYGFTGYVVNIASFMRHQTGVDEYHNPNAYTFLLKR